nr:hypothetical protein [uncultured Acetatifactor sp.]
MEECKERCRRLKEICFDGEVTMTKATLWMIAGLCLLAGIVRGLRMAPMTHGVMIGCGNGNGSGCGNGDSSGCEAGTGKPEQGNETGKKKVNRKDKKGCGCRCRCADKKRREKGQR